jgi:transcriptional regulator with XRE-family HTH domain
VETTPRGDDLFAAAFVDDMSGNLMHSGRLRKSQPYVQNEVAKAATDGRRLIYDNRYMERQWIAARLTELEAAGRDKNQAGLAAAMGLDKARITEMIQGRRAIKIPEVPALARYLEMTEDRVFSLELGRESPGAGAAADALLRLIEQRLQIRLADNLRADLINEASQHLFGEGDAPSAGR